MVCGIGMRTDLLQRIFSPKEPAPGLGFRILLFCRTASGSADTQSGGRHSTGSCGARRCHRRAARRRTADPQADARARSEQTACRLGAAPEIGALTRAQLHLQRQDIRDLLEEYRIGNLSEADRKRAEERSDG